MKAEIFDCPQCLVRFHLGDNEERIEMQCHFPDCERTFQIDTTNERLYLPTEDE